MLTQAGTFLFRYRNGLFPVACLLLFLPGPDIFDDPMQAAAIGGVVALLGQLIRGATIGLKYVVRGGRDRRVYAEDLVTDGIYSHTRNPMYVGNLLIAGGLAIVSNCWTTLAIAIPFGVFMYSAIIAAEEQYLAQRFGAAFRAYCADVPRWFPRLSGLGRTLFSMQFRWRRVLLKEYGTPVGWISVLSLMTIYNIWESGEWRSNADDIALLRSLIVGACCFWIVAWSLKKSRRLIAD
ncbi:MAG: isoprenylcysteine carboxylmethyltransferase family protein [Gammaproteobacteria bacterium]